MKKTNLILLVLAVLLVVSLAVNGILAVKLANQPQEPVPATQPSQHLYDPNHAIGADEPTTVPEETTEPAPGQVIASRFITFICPSDLVGTLDVTTTEGDDGVTMTFSGSFDGKTVQLFEICLTRAEVDGYKLGQFVDEQNGVFQVVMNMHQQNPEDWTAQTYNAICAIQERVNDFIIQLYEDARFEPDRG